MDDLITLEEFISLHFDSKADFARQIGIYPQQVTQWQNAGYMVCNGIMYKPMRQLVEIEQE